MIVGGIHMTVSVIHVSNVYDSYRLVKSLKGESTLLSFTLPSFTFLLQINSNVCKGNDSRHPLHLKPPLYKFSEGMTVSQMMNMSNLLELVANFFLLTVYWLPTLHSFTSFRPAIVFFVLIDPNLKLNGVTA